MYWGNWNRFAKYRFQLIMSGISIAYMVTVLVLGSRKENMITIYSMFHDLGRSILLLYSGRPMSLFRNKMLLWKLWQIRQNSWRMYLSRKDMIEFKIVTSKINFLDTTSKGVNIHFSSGTLWVNRKDNCSIRKKYCCIKLNYI